MDSARRFLGLLAAAALLAGCGRPAPDCGGLEITRPWVRAAPAVSEVRAGYFQARNAGERPVVITAAVSADFEGVQMHRSVTEDGQARMHPVEAVELAGGQRLRFEPGGHHLMLFQPRQAYAVGDRVRIELVCGRDEARLPVSAPVRSEPPEGWG